uniref:elongation factor 1-alpha-like n=1 Tax=Erigeron canadensis TaxID=72917 RepID=UPI001CB92894|nr:elongation factor 1-alpha-like [Erigeron canadensis]
MGKEKARINIVFIGHVDSGKSTTAGHLIYKLGGITDKELLRKLNKRSFRYAWVLDKLKAEREHGKTIDITLSKFETARYNFTVIDTPGHRDYIKNIITGTSMADCAVLVIDSALENCTYGISLGQTHENILLAYVLGIKQMICCCNKMDATKPKYSEPTFRSIVQRMSIYFAKIGYRPHEISYVPISALGGENMFRRSRKLSWYEGPTLCDALDKIIEPRRPSELPLRLPLSNVFNIDKIGTVAVGRVETGLIKPGMMVTFGPSGLTTEVKSVEMHKKNMSSAVAGDYVGFHLEYADVKALKRGYVASNSVDDPASGAVSFISHLVVTNHPGGELRNGYTPLLHCHTSHVAVKFEKILSKIDPKSFEELEKEPDFLKNGDAGIVKMVPIKPIVVEAFAKYPPLGRFVVSDRQQIIGVGVIMSVDNGGGSACRSS